MGACKNTNADQSPQQEMSKLMWVTCPGQFTSYLRFNQETIEPFLYLSKCRLYYAVDLWIMWGHFHCRIDEKAATTGRIAEQTFNTCLKKALKKLKKRRSLLLKCCNF